MTPEEQAILTPERIAHVNAIAKGEPEDAPELTQATRTRKRRSDAGVKKGPKVTPLAVDEVSVRLNLADARAIALLLPYEMKEIAFSIQEQVMVQLQRRIDARERQKEVSHVI